MLVYLAAAKISLVFGTVAGNATLFWMPGGIALAVVLLGGLKYLPAVFVGAYLSSVMVGNPLIVHLGTTAGNTLEVAFGYLLLKRCSRFNHEFARVQDLFLLVLMGGLIPTIASALLGPWSLYAAGFVSADLLPGVMWRWWRADVLAVVFFTPLVLVFSRPRRYLLEGNAVWEYLALWVFSFALGQTVILGGLPGFSILQGAALSWLLPAILWAGLRTGRRNTALIQLMFLTQAFASAYMHVGFFADDFAHFGLANFWMFAMVVGIVGMALAIMSNQQREAMRQIALNAKVFNVTSDGVLITDADNRILAVNPAFTELTGYLPEEVIGRNPGLLASGLHGDAFYDELWQSLNTSGRWDGEVWNRRKNGEVYLERLSIQTMTDARGRVINRIGIFSDITLQRQAQEAITHQAQHDFLTNLPNRLLFNDRFSQQLAFAHRHDTKFAVIYMDLDDFKPVNDTLGHHQGDCLLIAVADRLKSLVREIDTVSRFGGDEFAILVSEVSTVDDVTTLADKILETLRQPFQLNEDVVGISASLGIALFPDHGKDMETLLNSADGAMYRAKQLGNDTYVIAQESAQCET